MPKKSNKRSNKASGQPEAVPGPEISPAPETPFARLTAGIEDPIGDVSSGEARFYLGDESSVAETEAVPQNADETGSTNEPADHDSDSKEIQAELQSEAGSEDETGGEIESPVEPQPAPKLERLQKILSQAGIASRRRAEEMIEQGRVQVNGAVVTELGTKADPARDHIRVDGKLLHGAERHRYFMLNKPKGYVTTVSDPEGRPTVMQFLSKTHERLYPVGRLDYQSEGLLLMTNDGELANQLTRAGSGVEKMYLVKIAGKPTEEELEVLRRGVAIERGAPGSKTVHTAPARIRQVRQGENPWYEIVLIEGRNRELRKMFSAIGHFVEKIRRVGYGPLVLDLEPGKLRELEPEEVAALRLAAEGKLSRHAPRPERVGAQFEGLPPRSAQSRSAKSRPAKSLSGPGFDRKVGGKKDSHPRRGRRQGTRESQDRANLDRESQARANLDRPSPDRPDRYKDRYKGRPGSQPQWRERPMRDFGSRRSSGEDFRRTSGQKFGQRPDTGRNFSPRSGRPYGNPPLEGKPRQGRPAWRKDTGPGRPPRKDAFPPPDRAGRRFAEDRSPGQPSDAFAPNRPAGNRRDKKAPFPRDSYSNRSQRGRTGAGKPKFKKFPTSPQGQDKQSASSRSFGPGQRGRFRPSGKPRQNPKSGSRGSRPPLNHGRS